MHFFFLSCLFSFSFSSMFFKKHLFGCLGSCLQHATFSLHHMGFFTVVQRPEYRGSVVVSSGLSCCTECELLVPRPRFEPTSPAFQGRFFFFFDSLVGKESTCNAGDPGSTPGSGRSTGEGIGYPLQYSWASLVDQVVKNPPAMWEAWVRSPGEGDGY